MIMKLKMCEFVHGMTCKEVCELLGEIVRCRDCEYYGNNGYDNGYCYYWNTCGIENAIREPDDYCSRGSRKEA